jgi:RND family efflux transporter MFP subunit
MKRWIGIVLAVVVLAGFIGWRLKGKQAGVAAQKAAISARQKSPAAVNVASVTLTDVVHTYTGIGTVESPFIVRISSKVNGRVDFLQKREGDAVAAGEVVAKIDPTQVMAMINQAQSAAAEAEARLSQARLTQDPNTVNVHSQIDTQKAILNSAEANYTQTVQNYTSQVQAAQSAVTDAQSRLESSKAGIVSAKANIGSAKASNGNAQSKYNRTYDLYKQGFTNAQDVDDARTALDVAKAAVDVADSQLNAANSAVDSAQAQLVSAQKGLDIVVTKGKSDIAAAQAVVDQAKASLKFAHSNTANIPAYVENLRALKNEVDADKAQVRNYQSQLSDTVLRSSINGYITLRSVDPGTTVTPGQVILTVQDIKSLFITTPIREEVARRLALGQSGSIQFDAFPGQTFHANITQINPAADVQSRQFQVRMTLGNPKQTVKPGMTAHVTFVTDTVPNALMVPREAVLTGAVGQYVVVVNDDNVAHHVPVTVGTQNVTDVQVFGNVRAGQRVVILSMLPVKEGAKLKVNPATSAAHSSTVSVAAGGTPTAG